jgi:hypothetical protein
VGVRRQPKAARWVRTAVVSALIFCAAFPAFAASERPHITGIYSNLYYNRQGGDLLGTELFIVSAPAGYVLFFQNWEGGGSDPVAVPVKVLGDRISFTIPEPSLGAGDYEGRINRAGFEGSWHHRLADGSHRSDAIRLKRKSSYWQ